MRTETKIEDLGRAVTGNIYKRMIEEIQDYAIIVLDRNGYILDWNKGAEKIKQYTENEIIGKHFSIFYLPGDLAENLPARLLSEAEHTGRAGHEGWRKRKDGSKFWASVTITAIHDEAGNVVGYCKMTRDLTDRKASEDRLRMSEERYHRMVTEVQDYAIILLSVNGIIENWNAGAEKIKGYKKEEIVGKSFEVFYTAGDKADGLPQRLLKQARDTGRAGHEGWRVRKDGSRFWGSITITALHNKEGEVIGFSKVTRDLTEKKLAEDRLAAYTAELEAQNSELEQFAYVASHDLQEPLRKIRTFAELIREHYSDKEFADRYFEKLDNSARRMADLVRSLLDYSRLSKQEHSMGDVDLNTVLAEVEQDLELLIEEKRVDLRSDTLPVIHGSHMQMGQLITNLIGNAIKFARGAPVIRITASIVSKDEIEDAPKSLAEGDYHRIIFKDNGIGFDNQYRNLIFSLFQRLHGKQDYAGTGIGLALCKKIVENHNGYIAATGKPGEGAKFCVYLPVGLTKYYNA